MKIFARYLLAAALLAPAPLMAQPMAPNAVVVTSCGTQTYPVGSSQPVTQTAAGLQCTGATVTPSGTQNVNITQVGGSAVTSPLPTTTNPAARTLVPLDVSTVTTGGTAVTALTAGHKTAGGFLTNPKGAIVDLCINEIGTASGTTSAASTTCIVPGQNYTLTPSAGAVSVITSDSAHPYSGYGLN